MTRTPKSILLVTVDCLRADHVGFLGYPRPTTPFFDSLAGESFVFPAAIVAGAPTYYSLPAMLASRYPLALGRDVVGIAPDEPTLASALKQAGYATAAFAAANPYISSRFGYQRGFDTFQDFLENDFLKNDLPNEKSTPLIGHAASNISSGGWPSRINRVFQRVRPALGPLGVIYDELYFRYCQRVTPLAASLDGLRRFPSADVIIDAASRWLDSIANAPFFLWLHLMDPHSPYYPKEKALALMATGEITPGDARYRNSCWNRADLGPRRLARHRDAIIELYDAGIRWPDAQLARLAERLRGSGRWDNCIFAFTADHGEEFLDHDGRYHAPSRLTEELVHVPLLLRVPGTAKKELSQSPFSLLHLAPTLLDAAGISVPPSFRGTSHWLQIREGMAGETIAISECVEGCTNPMRSDSRLGPRILSVREKRYKLVLHFDPLRESLYDLEADPGEHAALPDSAQKPVRRRLLELAREHLRVIADERDSQTRVRTRLRELRLDAERDQS